MAAKDRELADMKAAVESAKETIVQQNEHIGSQDGCLRKARRNAAETQEDSKCQLQSLQEENLKLKSLVQRCFYLPLLTAQNASCVSTLDSPLLICIFCSTNTLELQPDLRPYECVFLTM